LFADPVILDLSRVQYIDTTCLSVLIRLRKDRVAKGYRPTLLVVPSAQILRVLEITRLDSLWPIYPTLAEARAALEA
jgi:anti-anti-sigma factor